MEKAKRFRESGAENSTRSIRAGPRTVAPARDAVRRQAKPWPLLLAVLALELGKVDRPFVLLGAARAPPRLAVRRPPEVRNLALERRRPRSISTSKYLVNAPHQCTDLLL